MKKALNLIEQVLGPNSIQLLLLLKLSEGDFLGFIKLVNVLDIEKVGKYFLSIKLLSIYYHLLSKLGGTIHPLIAFQILEDASYEQSRSGRSKSFKITSMIKLLKDFCQILADKINLDVKLFLKENASW